MQVLAIDPGKATGYALFVDGQLDHCGLALSRTAPRTNPIQCASEIAHAVWSVFKDGANQLVIEWPQAYTHGSIDRNDILPLCAIAGAIASRFPGPLVHVLPRTWKGQMPKDVCHARIKTRLSTDELALLAACCKGQPKTLQHNIWDAVGIGLHAVGRFSATKVIAR